MRPVCDTLPVVFRFCDYAPTAFLWIRYAPSIEVEASASMVLLILSPSAVRSHRAIKREEPNQGSAHSVLQSQKDCSFCMSFLCTADLDTAAKIEPDYPLCNTLISNKTPFRNKSATPKSAFRHTILYIKLLFINIISFVKKRSGVRTPVVAQIEQVENQLIKSIDFQLVFYNIVKILAKIKVFAQI